MAEITRSIGSEITFDQTEALVDRLKEGEEAAYAEAFELYRDLVYSLSWKLLNDRAEAMDVTQDVFLTLYRKIHGFREECSLKTWLYRIALNHISNRNRWWRRRFLHRTESLSLRLDGKSPLDPPSGQPTPERRIFAQELQRALQDGLQELPFEQRTCVIFRDVQGLSYEEIAEILNIQVGTVKSRIARGRERLRDLLKDYQRGAKS